MRALMTGAAMLMSALALAVAVAPLVREAATRPTAHNET